MLIYARISVRFSMTTGVAAHFLFALVKFYKRMKQSDTYNTQDNAVEPYYKQEHRYPPAVEVAMSCLGFSVFIITCVFSICIQTVSSLSPGFAVLAREIPAAQKVL